MKGRKALEKYPEPVRQGIIIHRAIDSFTDSHPLFKAGTARLHANYGKFAPVIMDVFYDHILAANWSDFSRQPLSEFCSDCYDMIDRHHHILPKRAQYLYRYMKRDNWLWSYRTPKGIAAILNRMDRRTGGISNMTRSVNELEQFRSEYKAEF